MTGDAQAGLEALSFEAALAELDSIIGRLEAGSIALDDAIAAYERGTQLARHCERLLDRTERRVNALVVGGDGRLVEKPLDVGEEQPAPEQPRALFPQPPSAPPRARAASIDPDDVPF